MPDRLPHVVGIDQSYSGFAVCILRQDGVHRVHCNGFSSAQHVGVDRLLAISAWFIATLQFPPIDIEHVCMEGYAPGAKFGRELAGELGAAVKLALRASPALRSPVCYPTVVAPTALKKFVLGRGNGAKSDMKLHVFKKWGVTFEDDNEADSYGLARIAAAIQWQRDGLLEYQKDVLRDLRHHTERQG